MICTRCEAHPPPPPLSMDYVKNTPVSPVTTVHMNLVPSLVWHMKQLNPGYCRCYILYLPISRFIFSVLLYTWNRNRRKSRGRRHQIHRTEAPETAPCAWPLPFIDKGVTPKSMAVDYTVAITGIFLIFPFFFASTRILITSSQKASQGAGCLHMEPSQTLRRTPLPPVLSIGTNNIRDCRVCGLAQDIQEVECGRLDIIPITEIIHMEAFSKNRR